MKIKIEMGRWLELESSVDKQQKNAYSQRARERDKKFRNTHAEIDSLIDR